MANGPRPILLLPHSPLSLFPINIIIHHRNLPLLLLLFLYTINLLSLLAVSELWLCHLNPSSSSNHLISSPILLLPLPKSGLPYLTQCSK
jgi:hypothetical protein